MYVAWYVNKQLLGVCSMICKQTITGCMEHDIKANNYWMYVAYVNKQLLGVCSMICKQTITGYVCSMICKQTITGCM